jgi:ribosome-associated translation inhibitor RaiA
MVTDTNSGRYLGDKYLSGNEKEYVITKLQPDTEYEIQIAAEIKGNVFESNVTYYHTLPKQEQPETTIPDSPTFQVSSVTENTITVEFDKKVGDTYTIMYKVHESDDASIKIEIKSTTEYTFTNLEKDTMYSIVVNAKNKYGSAKPYFANVKTAGKTSWSVETERPTKILESTRDKAMVDKTWVLISAYVNANVTHKTTYKNLDEIIAQQDATKLKKYASKLKKHQKLVEYADSLIKPIPSIQTKTPTTGFDLTWIPKQGTPKVKPLSGGHSGSSATRLDYPDGSSIVRKTPPDK